jgi:hypothetical protein
MADQLLCDRDPSKTIDILEERGSFLLIRAPAGFAVVEKRNGRIYPMTPDEREGVVMSAEGVSALLAEGGCLPESEARRLFNELGDRGDRLARTLR